MAIEFVEHQQGWAIKKYSPIAEAIEYANLLKEDGWTQELIDQLMDLLRKLKV